MIGFNYRNLFLQLIHGSLLLGAICTWYLGSFSEMCDYFSKYETFAIGAALFAAFIVGVFVDYIADWLEAFAVGYVVEPPAFYLLTRNNYCGIALAHRPSVTIRDQPWLAL